MPALVQKAPKLPYLPYTPYTMPKEPTRRAPLHQELIDQEGPNRKFAREKRKDRAERSEQFVDAGLSRKILQIAKEQQDELESRASPGSTDSRDLFAGLRSPAVEYNDSDADDDDEFGDEEYVDEEVVVSSHALPTVPSDTHRGMAGLTRDDADLCARSAGSRRIRSCFVQQVPPIRPTSTHFVSRQDS
jgi:hypothetical protein